MRVVLFFIVTVLGFIFCGLSGVIFKLFNKETRAFHIAGRLWAQMLLWAAGLSIHSEGYSLPNNASFVVCSNHASQMDIPVLFAALYLDFFFVAKKELFAIPFFGLILSAAGHIPIDRDNPREAVKALDEAKKRLEKGKSIVLFPEGTRSQDGRLKAFKSGGFRLAIKTGKPILPVAISNTHHALSKGSIVPKPCDVILRIGEPILVQADDTTDTLAIKTRSAINAMLMPENQQG